MIASPAASLDLLTTPVPTGPGRYSITILDGWQQGRGAFGGLVLAILTRAGEHTVADPTRTLRTLTAEIVGPTLPGPADLAVEVLRAGTGVTTVAARLTQGAEVCAHAVIVFARPRGTYDAPHGLVTPTPPPWRELPVAPLGPSVGPTFTQHVEFRVTGPAPFSGRVGDVSGWVRFRDPGRARDAAYAIAMADTFWPALLTGETAPRPAATLTFAFELVGDLAGLDPEAPWFYRARTLAARDGYAVEARELWGEDGRLIALNQQTFVVIK